MPIQRRRIVETSLGTLLSRTVDRLGLPRGTRLGVVVGHRQVRADRRFPRTPLPGTVTPKPDATVRQAVEALVLPRLPRDMANPRIVAYRPGERTTSCTGTLLRTARNWGDGKTTAQAEIFDAKVETTENELWSIYFGVEGDAAESKEVLLRAMCRLFDSAAEMHRIIAGHTF